MPRSLAVSAALHEELAASLEDLLDERDLLSSAKALLVRAINTERVRQAAKQSELGLDDPVSMVADHDKAEREKAIERAVDQAVEHLGMKPRKRKDRSAIARKKARRG